jgi:hypothetical protein
VTKLGEFALIGRLFTLAIFFKLQKEPTFIGLLFSQHQLCINFDKKLVGRHFGRLFINSSGHPARNATPEKQQQQGKLFRRKNRIT